MYTIGTIMNTHGIKGEVKINPSTDFNSRFNPGEIVYLPIKDRELELTIKKSRSHKQQLLVQFEGYESIQQVEEWKGSHLYIKSSQQKQLKENEYYYHEIIGCEMVTTEGMRLGEITSILAPGANDVWVVQDEKDQEYLIPYIADVVKKVDVQNKKVTIELMEGLID